MKVTTVDDVDAKLFFLEIRKYGHLRHRSRERAVLWQADCLLYWGGKRQTKDDRSGGMSTTKGRNTPSGKFRETPPPHRRRRERGINEITTGWSGGREWVHTWHPENWAVATVTDPVKRLSQRITSTIQNDGNSDEGLRTEIPMTTSTIEWWIDSPKTEKQMTIIKNKNDLKKEEKQTATSRSRNLWQSDGSSQLHVVNDDTAMWIFQPQVVTLRKSMCVKKREQKS